MKNINDFINESDNQFNVLNPILKKTGWPSLRINGDKAQCVDEDTTIYFELDDHYKTPFISKIECNFATSDPAHLRDLKGLVELFEEINKL